MMNENNKRNGGSEGCTPWSSGECSWGTPAVRATTPNKSSAMSDGVDTLMGAKPAIKNIILKHKTIKENDHVKNPKGKHSHSLINLLCGATGRICRLSYRRTSAHVIFMEYIRGVSKNLKKEEEKAKEAHPKTEDKKWTCKQTLLAVLTFLALLLLRQGIEPNPGPGGRNRNPNSKKTSLNIMSWNCDSLAEPERQKRIAKWAHNNDIDVICIQETRIENKEDLLVYTMEDYTMHCSPCTGYKYGTAIAIHNKHIDRIIGAKGHNDRHVEVYMAEPGYPTSGKSPKVLRIHSIYGPQNEQRTLQDERDRKRFWTNTDEILKEKLVGVRTLDIVGADCNGRLATAHGSREIGPYCLHEEFTKNGLSVLELMINNKLKAVNTLKLSDEEHGVDISKMSNDMKKSKLSTFNTSKGGHQIDYVLASKEMAIKKCKLAKEMFLREDVKAGHVPITCELEYRTIQQKQEQDNRENLKGPMDLAYCPQKLRDGIQKWRTAHGIKEVLRTTRQKAEIEHLNNYIEAINKVRDENPASTRWEQALKEVESVTAKFFPRKTGQEIKLEKAKEQGSNCQKSQRTASIEDQIQNKTTELLEVRKQLTKEVAKEAFTQWAARCKAVKGAEWRYDDNKRVEWWIKHENPTTGHQHIGWVPDRELKWVPENKNRLMNQRIKLLRKGWFAKVDRERLRSELKRSEAQDRNAYYDNLCKHVEEGDTFQEKINRTWQLVKKLNGKNKTSRSSKLTAIDSSKGPQILPQDKANAFGEFLKESFKEKENDIMTEEEWEEMAERPKESLPEEATLRSISQETREKLETPITKEEIVNAIKALKKGKAISTDHICSETLCLDPLGWANWLEPVINNMDSSTQAGRVIFLYKGKGSASDRANYRPISILSPLYKIWTSIQTKRCNMLVDDIASCWQFGFRRNRGCREALYSMQAVINKSAHDKLSLAMLDLSKAFDKANRKILFSKMIEYGAPKKFVDQIRKGHNDTMLTACFEGKYSETVHIQKGVYQGSPLSPVLYVVYAHSIFLDFQEEAGKQGLEQVELTNEPTDDSPYLKLLEGQVPKDGDHKIPMICYADDTNLIAPDMDSLQKAILIFNNTLKKYNMECNMGKTKILTRDKLSLEEKTRIAEQILQVKELEKIPEIFVDNAKFLGSLVNIKGYSKQACTARVNEGRKIDQALNYSFFRNEHISRENKMRVYNAVFGAVLLYGIDAYNYSENDLQGIQSIQNKILRSIYEGRIPPKEEREENYFQNREKNMVIQSELGAPTVRSLVERARLRFWGSLNRSKKLLNGAVLIYKLKLNKEATPDDKIRGKKQTKEQFDTQKKQIGALLDAFNQRFNSIRTEVQNSLNTEEERWAEERGKIGVEGGYHPLTTKQEWAEVKDIIHLEEKRELEETLQKEHHCTKTVARTSENIKTIFAKVQEIDENTPATMSEVLWKRLTNWVITTQAGNPNEETRQIKYECECCKKAFRDLSKHFDHQARARKKKPECAASDCIQYYASNKDPKIPIPTAELREEDDDVEMDISWATHPHRYRCPMERKFCEFPKMGQNWCIICRERENLVPERNKNDIRQKQVLNRKIKEYKVCTGLLHVPHSGPIELKCPRKLKTCEYPNEQGWWCKKCVDRSGIKPQGNFEKEKQAQERKKRKRSIKVVQEDEEPLKKQRKNAKGQPAKEGTISIDTNISVKKRPKKDKATPKDSQTEKSEVSSKNSVEKCPKGLKSCKYPSKGWWCISCNSLQKQVEGNIPQTEQDKTNLGKGIFLKDLPKDNMEQGSDNPHPNSQGNNKQVKPKEQQVVSKPKKVKMRRRPISPTPAEAKGMASSGTDEKAKVKEATSSKKLPAVSSASPNWGKRSYDDLLIVGGASSGHRILGRSSQQNNTANGNKNGETVTQRGYDSLGAQSELGP